MDIAAAKKRCEKYLTDEERKSLATWLHRDDYFGATGLSDDIQTMYRLAEVREALEEAQEAVGMPPRWSQLDALRIKSTTENSTLFSGSSYPHPGRWQLASSANRATPRRCHDPANGG